MNDAACWFESSLVVNGT